MKHIKLFEDFGTEHLEKQGSALGPLVKDFKDLIVGREYCMVDTGIDEWNGGYKYAGTRGSNAYIFTDTLGVPGMQKYAPGEPVEFAFTANEIANMMDRGEIAFDKNSK